jgi:hypothetical protein
VQITYFFLSDTVMTVRTVDPAEGEHDFKRDPHEPDARDLCVTIRKSMLRQEHGRQFLSRRRASLAAVEAESW